MVKQSHSKAAIIASAEEHTHQHQCLFLERQGSFIFHFSQSASCLVEAQSSAAQLNFLSPMGYPYSMDTSCVLATRIHGISLKSQVMHIFRAFGFAMFPFKTSEKVIGLLEKI